MQFLSDCASRLCGPKSILNMHAQISRGTMNLNFDMSLHLLPILHVLAQKVIGKLCRPWAVPEFLEREFICIELFGFALLILSHFA